MSCHIRLHQASKVYQVSEGHEPIGLWRALKAGGAGICTTDIVALEPLDLSIADGERVGIIGPNGAGKTTLLQLIAAIIAPTSGVVDVSGAVHPILNMGLSLRDDLTGRENIFVDGELYGRTRKESDSLVAEIVEFTELGHFIDLPVRTYSTGMRSRLAFALAIAVEPEILIIDEILSVGDAYFNASAQARMQELTSHGRIVLMVSHGLGSIRDNCTRCLWLDDGRLVMDGSPESVTAAYELAVTTKDEREQAERRCALRADSESEPGGPRVESISLRLPGGSVAGPVVESEQDLDLVVVLTLDGSTDIENLAFHVDVRRLDGIHVARCTYDGIPLSAGRSLVRYEMRPFCLGAGVYEIEAVLTNRGATMPAAYTQVEVVARRPLLGGVPMIYQAGISLEVHRTALDSAQ